MNKEKYDNATNVIKEKIGLEHLYNQLRSIKLNEISFDDFNISIGKSNLHIVNYELREQIFNIIKTFSEHRIKELEKEFENI